MRVLLILLLMCGACYAETINKEYSYKAFPYHGLSFKDRPTSEFNDTIIVGSCFYQEILEGKPEVDIFPDGMTGVVFRRCNLDNITIPLGNTVVGGSNKRIQVQNDHDDWIMEKKLFKWGAKEPINKERRVKANKSIDPKDIPKTKWTKEEREQFEKDIDDAEIVANIM